MKFKCLLFLFTLSIGVLAQEEKSNRLDSLFTAYHSENKFNGNVLIAEKGTIIYQKSFGYANLEDSIPLNIATKFELASVSKQFTATAIYILHKQGKLDLEDSISKYIPEWNFYPEIKIKHLVHHTSGLPDYMSLFQKHWHKEGIATNEDIIKLFAEKKPELNFSPNEKFEYSNTGYTILASIIERVTQQSYEDFLKEEIFIPLEMKNSFVYRSKYKPEKIENYATGYVEGLGGELIKTEALGKKHYFNYLDGIVGDGMVNSTLRDLFIWDQALIGNQFLNEEDKKILFKGTTINKGELTGYGFGWAVAEQSKYGKLVNHSGSWAGYLSFIERHIENKKTIILLQNQDQVYSKFPTKEIRKILYGEKIEIKKLTPVELTEQELKAYVGNYSNPNFPLNIEVFVKNNKLYTQATGQGAIEMKAYEDHIFTFEPAQIELTFNPEKNSMMLEQGSMKIEFLRKE